MRRNETLGVAVAVAVAVAFGLSASAAAQDLGFSADITAELGTGPSALLADEDIGLDDGAGGVTGPAFAPGLVPASAELIAWHDAGLGDSWASFDTTVALPGLPAGSPAEPRDVVAYDTSAGTFSLVFDGSAAGVPAGARVDALSVDNAGDILLSFDTTVALPGPVTAADEDLVVFNGGVFALFFDGSAAGVDPATDLDAAHMEDPGPMLLMSFDTSGTVGGVPYDDEDILEYDTGGGVFALYQDSSAATDPTDWPAADLVALPEPERGPALLLACGALALLARSRRS